MSDYENATQGMRHGASPCLVVSAVARWRAFCQTLLMAAS